MRALRWFLSGAIAGTAGGYWLRGKLDEGRERAELIDALGKSWAKSVRQMTHGGPDAATEGR